MCRILSQFFESFRSDTNVGHKTHPNGKMDFAGVPFRHRAIGRKTKNIINEKKRKLKTEILCFRALKWLLTISASCFGWRRLLLRNNTLMYSVCDLRL
jgi:hypothetical protein